VASRDSTTAIVDGKRIGGADLGKRLAKRIDPSRPESRTKPFKEDRDSGLPKALLARMQKQGFEPSTTDTSGNVVNPYGSSGLRQYISFPNLEQKQIDDIYNKRVQRFLAPETMSSINPRAMRRGFGSLFGGSEGEATISGPLRKQVQPMSAMEMGARGIFSLLPGNIFGPIVSMADPAGTRMVPESSPNYDPGLDPRNKPGGMISNMLSFFTGGVDPREAKDKVSELLPDFNLSGISSLLPDFNLNLESETNDLDEGPVENPFYPDMRRSVNEPSVIEAAVNEPIIPSVNMLGGSIIPDTPSRM